MALFTKGTSTTSPDTSGGPDSQVFSPEQEQGSEKTLRALDTPGFAYFLTQVKWLKNEDGPLEVIGAASADPSQYASEISDTYDVFQEKAEVAHELEVILCEELGRSNLALPEELGEQFLENLEVSLTKLATEYPARLSGISMNIKNFQETSRSIAEKEKVIATFQESLQKNREEIARLTQYERLIKPNTLSYHFNKSYVVARKYVERTYGAMEYISDYIKELEIEQGELYNAEHIKEEAEGQIDNLRFAILEDVGPIKETIGQIREFTVDEIRKRLEGDELDLQSAQAVQATFNTVGEIDRNFEGSNVYLQEDIDIKVKEELKKEIGAVIQALSEDPMTATISPAIQSLSLYIDTQSFGSKKGEDANRLVIEVLGEVLNNSNNKTQEALLTAARSFFLSRLNATP